MSRPVVWVFAAIMSMVVTNVVYLPAAWLVPMLERQTQGRISLTDVQGSLWHGSAVVGAAASDDEALSPLLPGRCTWRISPWLLLGSIDITLDNAAMTAKPVAIRGRWTQWEVGPARLEVPATGLTAFGAPMNTLQPDGVIRASWSVLRFHYAGAQWIVDGTVQVDVTEVTSALSAVRPLGAYRLDIDLQERETRLVLRSLSGPLRLTGEGSLVNGALHFSGQAQADDAQAPRLRTLMGLLGESRQLGDRMVVTLEL